MHLAEKMGCWISFEPLHESNGIEGEVWSELGIRDIPAYEAAVSRLLELKRSGSPIINSETYLEMIKALRPAFKCHASDIIMHVASDGTVESCRVHPEPLGKVQEGLAKVWESTRKRRARTVAGCKGCLFFGYVENSLLYEFVPEVMRHYEWM
jgi:MoaA/NifB/PqqE/SkfB family radical SAM enzyme